MKLDKMAEQQIRQALARGELDELKGAGKPFTAKQTSNATVEGFGYQTMASAGVLPDEIRLKKEIAALMPMVNQASDPKERKAIIARLADLQMQLGIHEEARRKYNG